MALEITVRLTRYDPVIKEISPFTTPREFLLWGHRFFPILVFTMVSIKKVFYVDLEKHHQRVLVHMLEKNMVSLHVCAKVANISRGSLTTMFLREGNGGRTAEFEPRIIAGTWKHQRN